MNPAMLAPDALPFEMPHVAPAKSKPRPKVKKKEATAPAVMPKANAATVRYKFALTIALGVFIPLMSLAMSKVAGTLAGHGHYILTAFGASIGVAVLAVSLSHLAWAIRDVTGSTPRASWALAVALDLSIVLGELVHVAASEAGLNAICWAVVAVVIGFSMLLNCHAFLNHKA